MIKNSLKNFGKNLLYIFIPMGIIYLFLILTIIMLASRTVSNLGVMLKDLGSLINESAQNSSASVNEFLSFSLEKLNWNGSLYDFIRQMFGTGWFEETVRGFFNTLNTGSASFGDEVNLIISTFKDKLVLDLTLSGIFCGIGVIAASFVTRFFVRIKTAKRNLKKTIIAHTVVPITQSLVIIAGIALVSVLKLYGILALLAVLAIYGAVSIISAWLIHREPGMKIRGVLTAKNIFKHILVTGIIFLITVCIGIALILINPLVGILLIVPIVIYSFTIIDCNTESYIATLVSENKAATAPEKPKKKAKAEA